MREAIENVLGRLSRAKEAAKESHASDMNSYGAGYDDGYVNALVSVLSMMNGEED